MSFPEYNPSNRLPTGKSRPPSSSGSSSGNRPPSVQGKNQPSSRGNINITPKSTNTRESLDFPNEESQPQPKKGIFAKNGSGLVMPPPSPEILLGPYQKPGMPGQKPGSRRDLANHIYKELLAEGISLDKDEHPVLVSGGPSGRRIATTAGRQLVEADTSVVASMASRLQQVEKENQGFRALLQESKAKNGKLEEEIRFLKETGGSPNLAVTNLNVHRILKNGTE